MVKKEELHEEAYNRILGHVKDMVVENDCKSIQIRTINMLTFVPL